MSKVVQYNGVNIKGIKGFGRLTEWQKDLFASVYKKHMEVVEDKEKWQVKSVSWQETFLRVNFQNGEWLHYSLGGYWY